MGDVIDLVLFQKGVIDDPGSILENMVDPSTVPDRLAAFRMGHDRAALVLLAQFVGTNPNEEVYLRKGEFGLPELESVAMLRRWSWSMVNVTSVKAECLPKVEEIVNTCVRTIKKIKIIIFEQEGTYHLRIFE